MKFVWFCFGLSCQGARQNKNGLFASPSVSSICEQHACLWGICFFFFYQMQINCRQMLCWNIWSLFGSVELHSVSINVAVVDPCTCSGPAVRQHPWTRVWGSLGSERGGLLIAPFVFVVTGQVQLRKGKTGKRRSVRDSCLRVDTQNNII